MNFFNASAGANSWTWLVTNTSPGNGTSQATAVFNYDPSMVPPGVFGGFGRLTSSDGVTDPFTWVGANGVLTWQLTNQSSNVETKTTYFGVWDGDVTVNGNSCNYNINFTLGVMTAVYQAPNP
jgi:hypothetical protein